MFFDNFWLNNKSKKLEFCFQFGNDEPIVFYSQLNMDNKVTITLEGESNITFNDKNGNKFTLLIRGKNGTS